MSYDADCRSMVMITEWRHRERAKHTNNMRHYAFESIGNVCCARDRQCYCRILVKTFTVWRMCKKDAFVPFDSCAIKKKALKSRRRQIIVVMFAFPLFWIVGKILGFFRFFFLLTVHCSAVDINSCVVCIYVVVSLWWQVVHALMGRVSLTLLLKYANQPRTTNRFTIGMSCCMHWTICQSHSLKHANIYKMR